MSCFIAEPESQKERSSAYKAAGERIL